MAEVLEAGPDGFDLSAELDATSISTTMKTCSACHEDKPQDAFSKKAWKARQVRRCVECTTADKPVTKAAPAKSKATPPRVARGGDDTELPLDSPPFKARDINSASLERLVSIFIERHFLLWRPPEVQAWLKRICAAVAEEVR